MFHHDESALQELLENDQWDRVLLFQIKRQLSNTSIENISDILVLLKSIKDEKRNEDVFSISFERKITDLESKFQDITHNDELDNIKNNFEMLTFDSLNLNDELRRESVHKSMSLISNKTAKDYYCAAVIYNHGSSQSDADLAFEYASKAKDLINKYDNTPLARKIRDEYSFTCDRYQLSQNKPQIYGTTYSPDKNVDKGWEKDKLVPPNKDYVYYSEDRLKMNDARQELGIQSLEEQERAWGVSQLEYPSLKSNSSRLTNADDSTMKPKP